MTTMTHGADPNRLDALGDGLRECATKTRRLGAQFGEQSKALRWDGSDADRFKSRARQMGEVEFRRIEQLLTQLADLARRNADDQRRTSDDDGGDHSPTHLRPIFDDDAAGRSAAYVSGLPYRGLDRLDDPLSDLFDAAGDRAERIWSTDLGDTDWGGGAASVANAAYGTSQVLTGVPLLLAGAAATATIPLVGQVGGPGVAAIGGLRAASGASKVARAFSQASELDESGQVDAGPDDSTVGDNAKRFVEGVRPRPEKVLDWIP